MSIILKAENISKQYRLGTVGTGTLGDDVKRWWYGIRGKEDPFLKVGAVNDRSSNATEDYVWALRDINFEVKHGEVLGIIGKNGAGKSTLLKLLSRVTAPTTGSIKTRGRIASLLEIGTGFHPELSGRENIFMNGAVLGMTKAEIKSKLDEIIAFSGCEKYIDTPVKRYSSGMTVRLGFAVAAHLEPEILVVDEVLAVGDAEFQKKAIGKMQDLSTGEGRTVLFVSHNMTSIEALCTNIIVLKNGIVFYKGDVQTGIQHYLEESISKPHEDNGGLFNIQTGREGTGDIKFEKVSFHASNKKIGNSRVLQTGKRMDVEMTIMNNLERRLYGVVVSIGFHGMNGNFLFACRSDSVGQVLSVEEDGIVVKMTIEKLPLIEGKYSYSLICYYQNEITDWIKNAGIIHIQEGDFYGHGKTPAKELKGVLINYKYDQIKSSAK